MDIQIKLDPNTGNIECIAGQEEMDMELSMGLAVECLEVNSGQVYLVESVDGILKAAPASATA